MALCRDAVTGLSFPVCTLSRETKLVTSVYSLGEGAKYSPGNRSGEPYTSSADEAFKSSFQELRIPNCLGTMLIGMAHQGGLQAFDGDSR